jgi:hypothetical protein
MQSFHIMVIVGAPRTRVTHAACANPAIRVALDADVGIDDQFMIVQV